MAERPRDRGGRTRGVRTLLSGALDLGQQPDGTYRGRRGPAKLVAETVVTALLAAVLLVLRVLLIEAAPFTPRTPAWVLGAVLLAVPMLTHAVRRPPRLVRGAVAGFGVATLGVVAAAVLQADAPWLSLAVLTAGFLVGAAVFGALAPVPALPARPEGPDGPHATVDEPTAPLR